MLSKSRSADTDRFAPETPRAATDSEDRKARVDADAFSRLVGTSEPMRELKRLLGKVARGASATVLVSGETGTGKDLVAHEIHRHSSRSGGPIQSIACSVLPETLMESELFGHEPGAFTDARRRKKGLVELAKGGTLFLDEIGELSNSVQVKLLTFLEHRVFRRLGGTREMTVDTRIIAATNQDLEQAIREGWFRSDLYYRLNVLPVRVPPLRERGDDIRPLLYHFIEFYNNELDLQIEDVSPEILQELCSYSWPGNVRELKNAVERAMLLAEDRVLTPKDFLGFPPRTSPHHYLELPREGVDLEEVEADLVIQALEQTQGNQTRAGRLLGLTRHQIHYRMEKLGLSSMDREKTRKSSTGRIS